MALLRLFHTSLKLLTAELVMYIQFLGLDPVNSVKANKELGIEQLLSFEMDNIILVGAGPRQS